ncbi:MAG: MBL fold metallo-hydrolase RNA specificity domain-containing protein [Nannocystaceae bacterium]|nr:MBL fold metallo-hydrolase [bacterium]
MELHFHGAVGQVTGSMHRLRVNGRDILLDCGLFQGRRAEADRENRQLPDWAAQAHALVLSHAHLDHSGNIPTLAKHGFKGNVFCTPCTRDLCAVMLRDAAMIQEQDARYINRRNAREGVEHKVEPLYDLADAQRAVSLMVSVGLHRPMMVAPGVTVTFHEAGHVLGSAVVQLDLEEKGVRRRLLFTGDLGREALPLLPSPEIVPDVDVLMTESTYGDRLHAEFQSTDDELGEIVRTTIDRGGRVYIPSFALERAQEVLFALTRLAADGKLPKVPIYVDSPLAVSITEIYKLHPEGLASSVQQRLLERIDPFSPPGMRYVTDVEDSKAIQTSGEPCIVIAGSGMCEAGRIVHHFRSGLEDAKNAVVIAGFMAQHTLGRRLVEGRKEVKVLGVPRDVRARVHSLQGLSAHADKKGLLDYVHRTRKRGRLGTAVIVHGEDKPRQALAQSIKDAGVPEVIVPQRGHVVSL